MKGKHKIVGWSRRGILKAYVYIQAVRLPTKQYSAGHNSFHTSPFKHVDRAIFMVSLILRENSITKGSAWPVERTGFSNISCIPGGWRGPNKSWLDKLNSRR